MFVTKMSSIIILLVCASFPVTSGSAIPMWEYLSRGEKMSHLYSIFTRQVDEQCALSGDMCRKGLLAHGLRRLYSLTDDDLDNMDPYQRGASDLIWNTMISGHMAHAEASPSTTSRPSLVIIAGNKADGANPLFRDDDYNTFTTGFEDVFGNSLSSNNNNRRHHAEQESSSILNERYALSSGLGSATLEQNWLTPPAPQGPMVVRVNLDGSPVQEDLRKPLPVDVDKEEFRLAKLRLPTIDQISTLFRNQRPRS